MERWRLRAGATALVLLVVFVGSGCWGRKFFRMPEETLRTATKVDSLLEENAVLKERIASLEDELRTQQDFARSSNAERRLELEELKDQLNALRELLRETQQNQPARSERRRVASPDTSGVRTSPPVASETSTAATTAPMTSPAGQGSIASTPPAASHDTTVAVKRGAGAADTAAGSAAPAPENLYRQIYLDYNRKEYQLALDESEAFLKEYPGDPLGEDVLFIRGSCLMELQNYFDALKEFSNLMQAYPQGRRVPGALLRTAIAYDMLGEREVAAGVVRRLLKEYPRSEEAAAAKERFGALLRE
jgi:TolA-binding protein